MGLHDLSSQGFMNLIHGRLETGCLSFDEEIFPWDVGLHFHHFVVPRITLLNAQKHLATLQFVVKRQQLFQLGVNKIKQALVCVKMDGMNLNLHQATG